ncbi:MAG: aldehyde dehydrogenase family protein [Gemmataceae bacterium]
MTQPFAAEVARCRAAQQAWAARPVRDRLRPVRELRHLLVERADALVAAVQADVRRSPDEVVATDLVPTAAAAKYLLTDAERILKPRRVGWRPLWLLGCRDTVHRRPWGVVGLIGTWNYPIYITAVPLLQALVAGNGVLWKPSEHTPKTADALETLFRDAGFPADLLVRLPGDRKAGPQLAEADIDFVHFTGSDGVGRKLAGRLGERLIPSVLELSGVDAVIVRHDAVVELAARSAWYGATLNAGQTCMASRRALVDAAVYGRFVEVLMPLAEASGGVGPLLLCPGSGASSARSNRGPTPPARRSSSSTTKSLTRCSPRFCRCRRSSATKPRWPGTTPTRSG